MWLWSLAALPAFISADVKFNIARQTALVEV
jgi:hypothetical protein